MSHPRTYEIGGIQVLLTMVRQVTEVGLESGQIPSRCPICKNPCDRLVIHHWGNGDSHAEKVEAILSGNYRRMCLSCNASLGQVFKGCYPNWEEQFTGLGKYFKDFPVTYKDFDGREDWWGLLSADEWEEITDIIQAYKNHKE